MSDYSVSCDGVAVDDDGVVYSLAVYYNGEAFNSFVAKESNVAGDNTRTELLEIEKQLTAIWRSSRGALFVTDEDGHVRRYERKKWRDWSVSKRALTSVRGLGETEVYAAGDEGIVYRWDGSEWSADSPRSATRFRASLDRRRTISMFRGSPGSSGAVTRTVGRRSRCRRGRISRESSSAPRRTFSYAEVMARCFGVLAPRGPTYLNPGTTSSRWRSIATRSTWRAVEKVSSRLVGRA